MLQNKMDMFSAECLPMASANFYSNQYAIKLRNFAMRALWEELITYPKPGLVSLIDTGSHSDMNAETFKHSIYSLRHYFFQMAELGSQDADFSILKLAGIRAEQLMLAATGGVNTHRGAIFILGLLVAAAAYRYKYAITNISLGDLVVDRWGSSLLCHRGSPNSHGAQVNQIYGKCGAVNEVLSGYNSVYRFALPVYNSVAAKTGSVKLARVQSFFTLMANVIDTNALHRGGLSGLVFSQNLAKNFLDAGGVYADDWEIAAKEIHTKLVALKISSGGCADLLGASLFIDKVDNE